MLRIQHPSCPRARIGSGIFGEKSNGAQSFVEEWRRQTKGRGLNQSLLHLGAPWQNSILSRRLPTLNFDTLRSHQASQRWSKLAFATPRGRGMKRRVVNLVIRLPLRRVGTSRAMCRWHSFWTKSSIGRHLPVNLNPRGS